MATLATIEREALPALPAAEIEQATPNVLAQVRRYLPPGDVLRVQAERLMVTAPSDASLEMRQALSNALNAADERQRQDLATVQNTRQVIGAIAAVAWLAVITLAVIGVAFPGTIPMCFTPGRSVVCPIHESLNGQQVMTSSRWDVVLVELLGAIAGLLGAVGSVFRFSRGALRYFFARATALKVAAGALCAVGGVLLFRAQIVPGVGNLDSSAQILGWSLVLGFAEELFTRQADRAVQALMFAVAAGDAEEPGAAEEVVRWLDESLSPKLDEAVQGGVAPVVRSIISQAVPAAVREAVAGPALTNFTGWVSVDVIDGSGQHLEIGADRRLTLNTCSKYTLDVVMTSGRGGSVALPLEITDGIDEGIAEFVVALDSSDIAWRNREQTVRVGGVDRPVAQFALTTGSDPGSRWVWIKVGQRGQLVLQIELEALIAGPSTTNELT